MIFELVTGSRLRARRRTKYLTKIRGEEEDRCVIVSISCCFPYCSLNSTCAPRLKKSILGTIIMKINSNVTHEQKDLKIILQYLTDDNWSIPTFVCVCWD